MYDRGKDHSSSNFSGFTDLPPGYRSHRMRELHKRKAEQSLKESNRYQEITAKKELYQMWRKTPSSKTGESFRRTMLRQRGYKPLDY